MKRRFEFKFRTKSLEVWDPDTPAITEHIEADSIKEAFQIFLKITDPLPEDLNDMRVWIEPLSSYNERVKK